MRIFQLFLMAILLTTASVPAFAEEDLTKCKMAVAMGLTDPSVAEAALPVMEEQFEQMVKDGLSGEGKKSFETILEAYKKLAKGECPAYEAINTQ